MTSTPLVSIVTPSFNKGRYLERTIRSVLDQDYPNIEYIVMDGGSTDDSIEILHRYDARISFWSSGPDGGQGSAVTEGWRRCRGEILAEVDASDLLSPGAVRRAVAAFNSNPDWAMLYSDSSWIDEEDQPILDFKGRKFDIADMLCGNYVAQPSVFMRRSSLEQVGYYDPSFHMSMDFDLWMRIGCEFQVGYLPGQVLGLMRRHVDSKSLTASGLWLEENIRVIDATLKSGVWQRTRPRLRAAAIGCALARHAGYCVRDGQPAEARWALWKMLRTRSLEPWRRYHRDLPQIAVHAFLGRPAADGIATAVRRLRRWPNLFHPRDTEA